MLDRPVLFAATTDPSRARAFYQDVLGLDFVADEPFALVFRTGPSQLRIQKLERHDPPEHTLLGWEVQGIEAAVDGLAIRGVVFDRFGHLEQDARGIWSAPGGTKIAWFTDPDGNRLSISEQT